MITVPLTPDLVRDVAELEPTDRGLVLHRLPTWVRRQLPDPPGAPCRRTRARRAQGRAGQRSRVS